MSDLEEYTKRLIWGGGREPLRFQFQHDLKKNIDNYLKWKSNILVKVYKNIM